MRKERLYENSLCRQRGGPLPENRWAWRCCWRASKSAERSARRRNRRVIKNTPRKMSTTSRNGAKCSAHFKILYSGSAGYHVRCEQKNAAIKYPPKRSSR